MVRLMVCRPAGQRQQNGSVRIAVDKPASSRRAVSRCGRKKPLYCYKLYCTDDSYDTLLPVGRHYIGKDETVAIERVNSRLRHWFARFRPVLCRKRSTWSTPPSHCLPPTT